MELHNFSAKTLEHWPVDRPIPYGKNARTHSDDQVDQIVASIREFGFTNPILVDKDDTIIAGHGRLAAAKRMGLETVPVIVLPHLSDAQRRAYILADNKLALNAGWDDELLAQELHALNGEDFDLSLIGFSDDELADLLGPLDDEPEEPVGEEDTVPDAPAVPVTVPGDVWILGKHRLMCGDSTSIDAVDKLMDGQKADMVFTDPPYNVAFNGRSGNHDVIKNDDLSEEQFEQFIENVCQTISAVDAPVHYVWCNWKFYGILQARIKYKACIVWAKNVFGLGRGYRHQHEFCLFFGDLDDGINGESDLWNIAKDTNYVHPTQKPVALAERAFSNHKSAKIILDLFGGSGSTIIACEKMKRLARLMELDPKYCDVIIKRWQDYTGKKAIHEETGKTFDEISEE